MSNQDWLERSRHAVWHPCTQMKQHETLPLVPIARGDGIRLTDFDGNTYLDGISSWWVNLFGHGEPRIRAAIARQLDSLEHVMLAGFTHRPVVELSERLAALSGLGHAFYASDGASATEIALKMSYHYWRNAGQPGKTRFACLEHSYHGETLGALGVTDVPLFSATYAPLRHAARVVPTPDARQAGDGVSAEDVALAAAAKLEILFAAEADSLAAIIVEPLVQGAAGMVFHHPRYLTELRRLCDRYGVHLIADEIAVGFGRTGTLFAHEQAGIRPDFLCLSKGITGGFLPLSCVLTRDDIYQAFYHDDVTQGFLHSHSYTGNALACSAALAVLDIFEQDRVLEKNRDTARRFSAELAAVREHRSVRHFRHLGMIWAFEVDTPRADFARAFFAEMLDAGCLLRPIGNTVYFMPPYCIGDEDMSRFAEATLSALDKLGGVAGGTSAPALP
jgi:adenosylmethionine-8-amino-7-oxononanoate aminotransferase